MGPIQLPANVYYSTYAWAPKDEVRFLCWTGPSGLPYIRAYDGNSGALRWSRAIRGMDLRGMSPDGQWLLYDLGEHYGAGLRKAAATNGSVRRTWPGIRNGAGRTIWKKDGSEWVECGGNKGAELVVYSMANKTPRVIDLPQHAGSEPAWYDSRGSLVSFDIKPGNMAYEPDQWYLTETMGKPKVRPITFPIPSGTTVASVSLSPTEEWVLWNFVIQESLPPWLTNGISLFSRAPVYGQIAEWREIWVSKPNGSRMRKIGQTSLSPNRQNAYSIEWSRTGNSICFVRDGRLYQVPFRE